MKISTRKIAKALAVFATAMAFPAAGALAAAPSGQYSCGLTKNFSGFEAWTQNSQNEGTTADLYLDFDHNTGAAAVNLVNNYGTSNATNVEATITNATLAVNQGGIPNYYIVNLNFTSKNVTPNILNHSSASVTFGVSPVNGGNTLIVMSMPTNIANNAGTGGQWTGVCNRP